MYFLAGETYNCGFINTRRRAKIAIMSRREWERDREEEGRD